MSSAICLGVFTRLCANRDRSCMMPSLLHEISPGWGTGKISALLERGQKAYDAGAYMDAMQAWRRAAQRGSAEAAFRVGELYTKGQGVARSFPDAVVWYESAAEAGYVEAQLQLGRIFLDGVAAPLWAPDFWRRALESEGAVS